MNIVVLLLIILLAFGIFYFIKSVKEEKESKNNLTKKIISGVIIVFALLGIFYKAITIPSNDTSTQDGVKLELTSEMKEEIQTYIKDIKSNIGGIVFCKKNFSDFKDFTSIEITSESQTDKYTYTVYAICKYKDNYNDTNTERVQIDYTAEKDSTKETGFTIYELVK